MLTPSNIAITPKTTFHVAFAPLARVSACKVRRVLRVTNASSSAASTSNSTAVAKVLTQLELAKQLAAGVGFTFFPQHALQQMGSCCGGAKLVTLMQTAGVLHLTTASAVAYVLGEAVKNQRMGSETYQRLAVAVILQAVLGTVACIQMGSPPLPSTPYVAIASVALYALLGTALLREAGWTLQDAPGKFFGTLQGSAALLLNKSQSALVGAFYTFCSLWVAAAIPLLFTGYRIPDVVNVPGVWGTLMFKHTAITLIPVLFAFISLKDASDRGRLGASTFRLFNATNAALGFIKLTRLGLLYRAGALPMKLAVVAGLLQLTFASTSLALARFKAEGA